MADHVRTRTEYLRGAWGAAAIAALGGIEPFFVSSWPFRIALSTIGVVAVVISILTFLKAHHLS
jgi:hypothetical protein